MTNEEVETPRWSSNRWWTMIGLVFATQLGLIFWLGRPQRSIPVANDLAPSFQLAGTNAAAALALSDPTLFALPHREGFSGEAWLIITQEFLPFDSSEPPHWLSLNHERLGASFKEFASTNQASDLPIFAQPELQLKQPEVLETEFFPTQSIYRVTGDLAARRLVVPPKIPAGFPSLPGAEILTNSVLQVGVGGDGLPVSVVLLASSGSTEADQRALRETRQARFEPASPLEPARITAGLAWGQFVFEWYTLPVSATNSAPRSASAK